MNKVFTSPNRYIQGNGVIKEFGRYVSHLGSRPFILGGKTALSTIRDIVSKSASETYMECAFAVFSGKGTRADAAGLVKKATDFNGDFVVGAGGGAAIDTAKVVAHEMDLPLVIVPTIASTDAPCSSAAVQHKEDHQFDRVVKLKRNPDVVIVDSKIIADSPTRYFVAGMGDALSTWFEAQTCSKSGAKNSAGSTATAMGLTSAKLAYDILLDYGVAAKLAVDQNVVTPAVEMVIEANTLLSSIGFENCGLAVAHAIYPGIEALKGAEDCLHGELVGFCTLVSLVLENYPKDEINEVIEFCDSVGLPITMEQLGVKDMSPSNLMKVAEITFSEGSFIYNLSFEPTRELLVDSIIGADALGTAHRMGQKT